MKFLKYLIVLQVLIQVLFHHAVYGEEYTGPQLSASQGTVLVTLYVDNLHAKNQQIKVNKRKLILTFNTGNDHLLGTNYNFTAGVKLKITAKDINGDTLKEFPPIALEIKNTQPEDIVVIEFQSHETVNNLEIFIFDPGYAVQPTADSALLNQHTKLTVELKDELGFGIFDKDGEYIVPTNLKVSPCSGCTSDDLSKVTFQWNLAQGTNLQHFQSYDLEILKVEPDEEGSVSVDWNRASTIEVNANEYEMTLAEGTGFYLWRVRGIGSYYPGGRSDKRNHGKWSSHISEGTTSTLYNASPTQPNKSDAEDVEINPLGPGKTPSEISKNYFYYNQFDEDINWIYNKVLTEGSRQSETMTYANGLNQVQQVQTKLFSFQKVLATQNVYDYSGRASLQTLVAPVGDDNKLGYDSNFFKNSLGNVYSAVDFDEDARIYNPEGLENPAGTPNHYYSNNNTTTGIMAKYIPTAGDYPYIRTLYYNDPTGRVYKQSGAGDAMHLKADNQDPHNIIYGYSGVTQDELDLIFGSEAPLAKTVFKKITVDPNKVSSVSYITKLGQLLSTALSKGVQTPALEDICTDDQNTPEDECGSGVEDIFDPGLFAEGSFVSISSKSLYIDEPSRTIELDYKITPKTFTISCPGNPDICSTCDYRVEIEILYPEDPSAPGRYFKIAFDVPALQLANCVEQQALILGTNNIPQVQYWNEFGGTSQNRNWNDSSIKRIRLAKGTYLIEKRVYVKNNDPTTGLSYLDNYLEQYRGRSESWTLDSNCCGPKALDTSFYDCDGASIYCADTVGDEFSDPDGFPQLVDRIYDIVKREQTTQFEAEEGPQNYKNKLKDPASLTSNDLYHGDESEIQDKQKIEEMVLDLVDKNYISCDNLSDCLLISSAMLEQNIVMACRENSRPRETIDEQGFPLTEPPEGDVDLENPPVSEYDDEFDFVKAFQQCLGHPQGDCEKLKRIITWHTEKPGPVPSEETLAYIDHNIDGTTTMYVRIPKPGYVEGEPVNQLLFQGLSMNEGCVRSFFYDDTSQDKKELENHESILGTKQEAMVRVCNCIKNVAESETAPPEQTPEQIIAKIESECEDVCDSKRLMFNYEIDRYIAEQNHKDGVYTPDQVDENGDLLWKGYDHFFPDMSRECLLDIMVSQCKSQCHLMVRRSVNQEKLEDPENNLEYLEYMQSAEFREALEKEQLEFEQAFMHNAEVAPVGSYLNAPDLETAQNEIVDFIYSSLKEGLIDREKTASYQTEPPARYSLTFNFIPGSGNPSVHYNPDTLVYNQKVQNFLYPIGNTSVVDEGTIFKEVTVVVNTIWDERWEGDDTLLGTERYRTADDRVLQYDIAFYCGDNRIAYFSQFARASISTNGNQLNCYLSTLYPEINNPYSVIDVERNMLDIYFDAAQMLHIIPAKSNCEDSIELVNGQGLMFENISPYHALRVFSFGLADVSEVKTLLVEIDEGGSKNLLYQAPVLIEPSVTPPTTNERKIVDAINNTTQGHNYKAYLGDPHLDNPSSSEVFIKLDAKDTREDPSQYNLNFVVEADTDIDDIVEDPVSRNYVTIRPLSALISGCTEVSPEIAICPYLLEPPDSIRSKKFGYHYLLGKQYTSTLSTDEYHSNGDAVLSEETTLLTPQESMKKGSFWKKEKIDLDAPFEMEFEVYLGKLDKGADGIAFVLHNDPRELFALGGYGPGMGYGSSSWVGFGRIKPSIAIEIDTFRDKFDAISGTTTGEIPYVDDHIAVVANGTFYGTPLAGPVSARSDAANIEDGKIHTLKIVWSGHPDNTLKVFFDGESRLSLTKDIKYEIFSGEDVWWGWTGATRKAASNKQWVKPIVRTDPCEPCEICMRWYEVPSPDEILTNLGDFPPVQEYTCEGLREEYVNNETDYYLDRCLESKLEEIETTYEDSCLKNIHDKFKITYLLGYHHYTLYYYDRAGNLIKTVPPQGVNLADPDNHTLATTYTYNSIKQLVSQTTPDGGKTRFWYNALGQQVLIQDAAQLQSGKYSYIKYDKLGRVIETGELENFRPLFRDSEQQIIRQLWNNADFPDGIIPPPIPPLTKKEVTYTIYSQPAPGEVYPGKQQTHLRNRISYSWRDEDGNSTSTNDQYHTYYSYDPHGNVEWLVQKLPEIGRKTVRYEYDLVSGNVNKVIFQENTKEQFIHRYEYDEDNRITAVYTSTDGILWDKDVGYSYYLHGPLARAEVGEDKIQGTDYVYTIEGYLKSINQVQLQPNFDPGGDGSNPDGFLKDEFAMELGYYQGDYDRNGTNIGKKNSAIDAFETGQLATDKSLYNGNIASWLTNLRSGNSGSSVNQIGLKMNLYRYDRLNRLKNVDFRKYDSSVSPAAWTNPGKTYDEEEFTYDANGNILSVQRYGWSRYGQSGDLKMDSLTYHINTPTNNRLMYIDDSIGLVNTTTPDSSDLPDQSPNNYQYDAEGKLIADVSEGLEIAWNVLDKVKEVINSKTQKKITFGYNSLGHRVIKKVTDLQNNEEEKTTFYVRDVQGNILAVYTKQKEEVQLPRGGTIEETVYRLSELPIYGSSRIGVYRPDIKVSVSGPPGGTPPGVLDCLRLEKEYDIHSELRHWTVSTGPAGNRKSGAHMLLSYGQATVFEGEAATDELSENDLYMGKNVAVAEDEDRQKVFEFFVTNVSEQPVQMNGLLGEYYNNATLTGVPETVRSDSNINFSWGSDSPMPGLINGDNFGVRWTGQINIDQSGEYDFLHQTDGGSRLWIDDTPVIDQWNETENVQNITGSRIHLVQGRHRIKAEYSDTAGDATIKLRWRKFELFPLDPSDFDIHIYRETYWIYWEKVFGRGWISFPAYDSYTFLIKGGKCKSFEIGGHTLDVHSTPDGCLVGPARIPQGTYDFEIEFYEDHESTQIYWDGGLFAQSELVSTHDLYYDAPDVAWLLDNEGKLIDEHHAIRASRDYNSIIVKAPGRDSEKYFLITGTDGKLYYHTIYANPYSAILTKKYDPLTLTTGQELQYGGVVNPYALAAYNDLYHAGRNLLYVGMNRGDSVELYTFKIDANGIGQGTLLDTFPNPTPCTGCTDIGEMQISPEGDSLSLAYTVFDGSVYTHKISVYDFASGSVSKTIDIGTEPNPGTGQGASLKLRHRAMSFDYSPSGKYLYYAKHNCPANVLICYGSSQKPAELMRVDLESSSPTSEKIIDINLERFEGSVRRGADGKLYLNCVSSADPGQSSLQAFSKLDSSNVNEVINSQSPLDLHKGKNRFGLPLQPYRINSECRERDKGLLAERKIGLKLYEFTDHLKNVRVVLSDKRNATISGGDISSSEPVVKSWADYYAFGALMPGRRYESEDYIFGFNGMLKENQPRGIGNTYYTYFRSYDPRLGRWTSIDPEASRYPTFSPYVFSLNNPIFLNDPIGAQPKRWKIYMEARKQITPVYFEAEKGRSKRLDRLMKEIIERGITFYVVPDKQAVSYDIPVAGRAKGWKVELTESDLVSLQRGAHPSVTLVHELTHAITQRNKITSLARRLQRNKLTRQQFVKECLEFDREAERIAIETVLEYQHGKPWEELKKDPKIREIAERELRRQLEKKERKWEHIYRKQYEEITGKPAYDPEEITGESTK